jgi:hypothetical protein
MALDAMEKSVTFNRTPSPLSTMSLRSHCIYGAILPNVGMPEVKMCLHYEQRGVTRELNIFENCVLSKRNKTQKNQSSFVGRSHLERYYVA